MVLLYLGMPFSALTLTSSKLDISHDVTCPL